MQCPECFDSELEEKDDYLECPECGSQFDADSEEDDIIPFGE